jgi:hypothetical protein
VPVGLWRVRQLSDSRRGTRLGLAIRQELLDRPLALAARGFEQLAVVLVRQVPGEEADSREVQPAVCHHLEDDREPPRLSRRRDPQIRGALVEP